MSGHEDVILCLVASCLLFYSAFRATNDCVMEPKMTSIKVAINMMDKSMARYRIRYNKKLGGYVFLNH